MSEILVSVVIPSLNSRRHIAESIDSVLLQTYKPIECIVVDGGSTDGTIDVLKNYGDRIRWISEKDRGQSSAINKGFRRSSGEVWTWIGADDILFSYAVEKAVKRFADEPKVGLVYGDIIIIDDEGNEKEYVQAGSLSLRRLLNENQSITQPGSFYRADKVKQVGYLDEELHYTMDYDLFIKLMKISEASYIEQPLAKFRMSGYNKSSRRGKLMSSVEGFLVAQKHGGRLFCRENLARAKAIVRYFYGQILRSGYGK